MQLFDIFGNQVTPEKINKNIFTIWFNIKILKKFKLCFND